MPTVAPCLIHSHDPSGGPVVRLGVPQLDDYLEFLSGRCRPNTVLAVAYDLKVFFEVVGKAPKRVRPPDVLGFMTAQRTGQTSLSQQLQPVEDEARGVSSRTVRRRLSSVSGLFAFLHVRGDVATNPVPRGLPTRRERQRPRQGVPLVRTTRTLPRILTPDEVDALTASLRTHRGRDTDRLLRSRGRLPRRPRPDAGIGPSDARGGRHLAGGHHDHQRCRPRGPVGQRRPHVLAASPYPQPHSGGRRPPRCLAGHSHRPWPPQPRVHTAARGRQRVHGLPKPPDPIA
jgi:Phage integrase, N-terminal SAM-like domain